jgi:hypothetical protein
VNPTTEWILIAIVVLLTLTRIQQYVVERRARKARWRERLRLMTMEGPPTRGQLRHKLDSVRFEPAIGHDAGRRINKALRDDRGQNLVEYAMVAGITTVVAYLLLGLFTALHGGL